MSDPAGETGHAPFDDLIVPWSEVRPDDLVLHQGALIPHEGVRLVEKPWGDGTVKLFADVSHRLENGHLVTSEYRADDLTGVRREAPTEWGVRFSPGSGRPRDLPLGTRDDAQETVEVLRAEQPGWGAVLVAREPERPAGPWRLAYGPATGETGEET
jgi:hypothetical protein